MTTTIDHTTCLHPATKSARAGCRRKINRAEALGFEIEPALDNDLNPTGQFHLISPEGEWENTFRSPLAAAEAALDTHQAALDELQRERQINDALGDGIDEITAEANAASELLDENDLIPASLSADECDWDAHQAAIDEAGFCPVCQQ